MWTDSQAEGTLRLNGGYVATGYSGSESGGGKNDPMKQEIHNVGPIPRGRWLIGEAYTDPERGPLVMPLTPAPGTETFGRSGFLIHGDAFGALAGCASEGCIILPHDVRAMISASTDRELLVVGYDSEVCTC